jgi:hypothetical protein
MLTPARVLKAWAASGGGSTLPKEQALEFARHIEADVMLNLNEWSRRHLGLELRSPIGDRVTRECQKLRTAVDELRSERGAEPLKTPWQGWPGFQKEA